MTSSDQTLTHAALQALTNITNDQGLIFSLYLDLRPGQNSAGLVDRYAVLLQQAEEQKKLDQQPPEYLEQWRKTADGVRARLESVQIQGQGQGLAIFQNESGELAQLFVLPVSVLDRLVAKEQPFLRPLELLLAEAQPTQAAGAESTSSQFEREIEMQRVEELVTTATDSGSAVLGLEQTLLGVKAKKVRMLVVDEDFHQEGGECPNCGFLGEGEEGVCLLCGMALWPELDIVEVAAKKVVDNGGAIEILRSPSAKQAMEEQGRIGAFITQPSDKPVEKESANQTTITHGGEVHPEAVHDETVQESFPASDPPGGY